MEITDALTLYGQQRAGDLALVQAALRHRSIAATTVYVEVQDERLRAAMGAGR